ncbi:MAG: succinylglutamate-semialdehyde dehydrogenase [Candidatus Nomurabacteria bacterium]|jgi:succinylglutamic semialdehyde dehydrogenase|nr:succinylglutamate-semialdehyde dehydrogenase [Candidatus Nomurabacteria bacterium]
MNYTINTFNSLNPATEEIIWTGTVSGESEILEIVQLAKVSQPFWEALGLGSRKEIIKRFALLVEEHSEEAATIIAEENGKPLWEARTEINSLVNKVQAVFDAYDERAKEKTKEVNGRTSVTRYRAHGIMAVLGPFNFPMSMPNSHIMPSLLAGNTVIFKPSERVPKSAEYYVSLWHKAGVPANVLQIVHGNEDVGDFLIRQPDVNGILMIGSRHAGVAIQKKLADASDKICALEMGGNSPLVIWDYDDVRLAVHIAIQSAYISSGQRCSAARRLIVNQAVVSEFIPALKIAVERIVVGKQFDTEPIPFMGALIDQNAVKRFFSDYFELTSKGAKVIVPADTIPSLGRNFIRPSIIDVTDINAKDTEIFGPLLQLSTARDLQQAISDANATQFGLAAGIVTKSREIYEQFYTNTKAGIINWNQPLTGAMTTAPFGGAKASGNYRPAGFLSVDYCSYPCASIEDAAPSVPAKLLPGLNY